nr:MAG TPA: hypothetical protein [Caudoviricetes sp.]
MPIPSATSFWLRSPRFSTRRVFFLGLVSNCVHHL